MAPPRWLFAVLILAILAVWLYRNATTAPLRPAPPTLPYTPPPSDDTVTYLGQTIKLSKAYTEYDDYKNDPNNIAASELPRVQTLIAQAPVAASYPTHTGLISAMTNLKFPGYSLGTFSISNIPPNEVWLAFSIEIPHASKSRYLLYRASTSAGPYFRVDDFIDKDALPFRSTLTPTAVEYRDVQNQLLFSRPPPPSK